MIEGRAAIADTLTSVVAATFGAEAAATDLELRLATRPEFGHYQSSVAMRLGKQLSRPPRAIAEELAAALTGNEVIEPAEVAGPGFLNFRLRADFLANQVTSMLGDARLGLPERPGERVVIDYSSPNVAKPMHVGHLRSSVIGDALSRILEFYGDDVVRQNHLGDWGTQFGMLIEQMEADQLTGASLTLEDILGIYRRARQRFDSDFSFAEAARARVVRLQSGDPETLRMWQRLVDVSLAEFQQVYDRLGLLLTPADVRGESSYNDALPGVVADLAELGLLQESDGAQVVFPPGFTSREGDPLPMIVRKADGGFGYGATDLAAVRHRVGELKAGRLIYVVGVPQALHFEQVFAVARMAGWLPDHVHAAHVANGSILGEDRKPFKTRSGDLLALTSLLDSAVDKARQLLLDRERQAPVGAATLTAEELERLAVIIGIGAIKYADLSSDLIKDYAFSLDRMIATEGRTGPYLQYAHARLANILGKAGDLPHQLTVSGLTEPAELALAFALQQFASTVTTVAATLEPHTLCSYLFDLASTISRFYESCPVLKAEGEDRTRRLGLCTASAAVLKQGMALLGIEAPDRI